MTREVPQSMQPTVLSIAGSDPTGGAGLQADLKTMTAIGVYGAAAVTCITVQNSHGVKRVAPLEPELVAEQISAVLEDHHVTHIKTGMIGTPGIARSLCRAIEEYAGELIVDPVLVSTTGQELFQADGLTLLKDSLLNRATVLTPNLPELAAITAREISDHESAIRAADELMKTYPHLRALIVKGGHGDNGREVTDFLLHRSGSSILLASSTRPLVKTSNTHGTGCTLASAFAAFHCLLRDDEESFYRSTGYMQQTLTGSADRVIVKNSQGCGGFLHFLPGE